MVGMGDGKTCDNYCTDWVAKCMALEADQYTDKAACMTDCMGTFDEADLCCRAYHVNNMPPADHCGHAMGEGPCAL